MVVLDRLLRPRSIAVVGGGIAEQVIAQCEAMGYDGEIFAVHPSRAEVAGRKAYPSIADLPAPPDAAFIGVNRHATIDVIADLRAIGAGGAVVYASGFAEAGAAGAALQARLIAAADGMPVFGPNCYGFINYLDGALLWPDQHGGRRVERGVAIVSQSGNIAITITMNRRALPLAYVITLGNQAAVGLSDAILALAEDERVTAIGLHVEGIDDPACFASAIKVARAAGKPVVALKVGRSDTGAALTVSHTAALVSRDALVDAFFARIGVARVESLPVLLETLKILHAYGPLPGGRVAFMSCSGGEAALVADAVAETGLSLPALNEDQRRRVAATVPDLVTVSNPLDYHTFLWGDGPALSDVFAAMMDLDTDLTGLIIDFPRPDRCDAAEWWVSTDALAVARDRSDRRAVVVATLPETMTDDIADRLMDADLVPLLGLNDALAAIEAAVALEPVGPFEPPSVARAAELIPSTNLDEYRAKRLLAEHGVPVPAGRLYLGSEEVAEAFEHLNAPLVAKAIGPDIAHKSEIGAVRLGLDSGPALQDAAEALGRLSDTLLVEDMVTDGVAELIVGVTRDPQFGPHLTIGSGGVLVELVADSRVLLIPADDSDIRAAILSLKAAKLIAGYRGKPAGDLDAAVDAIRAIQDYALANGARLVELDVNPLIVRPAGHGVVAADALIRFIEE